MLKKLNPLFTHLNIRPTMCERSCVTLFTQNVSAYQPDTLDLNTDSKAAAYWFPLFRDMIAKFSRQAAESQRSTDTTADERAELFRLAFLTKLEEFERLAHSANNAPTEVLGIRTLLELNEQQLRRFGFPDPWLSQKTNENTAAIDLLTARLREIDDIANVDERWTELVRGVLAGNMFDWGAEAVATILVNDENFGLHAARERIQKRPWLMDSLDSWLARLRSDEPHKCAVIFVDNSGVDIVLGILPFARELLKRGTKVLLCANSEPTLNDVTTCELQQILQKCSCHCAILDNALKSDRLLVYSNGQVGPCLDMRRLPSDLCEAIDANETDLLVIEGMGRALHTNLYAKFNCETLKLAVVKNKWLAERLGGETFAVICKYEHS